MSLEGGPGFIRGTHTAWRHGKYIFIADEVFGNDAAEALFKGEITRAHGRLQVLDVSDIEHPKSVAWYEPEFGGVHNVWVAGDTLYVGAYNAGLPRVRRLRRAARRSCARRDARSRTSTPARPTERFRTRR